jgi:hypothetical protein
MSVFGAGMGNASSHEATNLPILVAAVQPVGADAAGDGRGDRQVWHQHPGAPRRPQCVIWIRHLDPSGIAMFSTGSAIRRRQTSC